MAPPLSHSTIINAAAGTVGIAVVVLGASNARAFINNIAQNAQPKLIFPADLDRFPVSMSFQFQKYQRRSIFAQLYTKPDGSIRLPIPKNIIDRTTANWDQTSESPVVGAALEYGTDAAASNITSGGILGALNTIVATTAGAGIGASVAGLQNTVSTLADNSAKLLTGLNLNQVLQPFGMAVNPFLTVLFKQPTFKKHSFQWKLIPRDPNEARTINALINNFKYHMLPDILPNTAGTMLQYPDMVQMGFYGGDNFLYRFKPCVIENVQVNYAPSESPSFFKGSENIPTEIDFSVDFLEIEYWTKKDFDPVTNGNVATGGYIPATSSIAP